MTLSKPYFLLTLFLCSTFALFAQETTYDLSNYKARFERRPGMNMTFNSDFEGNYNSQTPGTFSGVFDGTTSWFLNRNTDELISNWYVGGTLSIGRRTRALSTVGVINIRQRDDYLLSMNLGLRQDRYTRPNRFWGYRINFFGSELGSEEKDGSNNRIGSFRTSASLYRGTGRIEFAEDALLAGWMLDELQATGVTPNYSDEDVEALARTITFIIGNRVFDFRRRRIYELEQLQETLLERGITQEESFQLFAILNDNWAFANRATLTHGNRFSYGLQANIQGGSNRDLVNDERFRTLDNTYGLFADYTRSRIVKNNNGSHSFSARAGLDYYQDFEQFDDDDTQAESGGWAVSASLNYTRSWLPNSRTTFRWSNTLSTERYLQTNYGFDRVGFTDVIFTDTFRSGLEVDYFINYQWTFSLNAGLLAWHMPERNLPVGFFRGEQVFGVQPFVQFRTNYFFF